MKKIIVLVIVAVILLSIILIRFTGKAGEAGEANEAPDAVQIATTAPKETTKPQEVNPQPKGIDANVQCTKIAEQYVKVVKNGSSRDLYLDRLGKVKGILSDELYQKMTPNMSDAEITSTREQSKQLKDKDVINTTLDSISSASRKITDEDYEVYVIYVLNVSQNETATTSRYLMRMKIHMHNGGYQIYKILEDSDLGNNFYQ